MDEVTVIGAGLAGTECAWQLAERGVPVRLIEQKPLKRTPAQNTDFLAELVCSNSMRGASLGNAVGLIKEEMRRAGSLVMECAEVAKVPAGGALAVDRDVFSAEVTKRIQAHARIRLEASEVQSVPTSGNVVIATGPLTGDALATDLARIVGGDHLAYYDAIAPIVVAESIDWSKVFKASRYDKGGDDAYVNCPFTKEEYEAFVAAIVAAEKVKPREFEEVKYFEGCLPIEVMAERGPRTLSFGPMKPVGLTDPKTGRWPKAVVQLRQEDQAATAYNMVGFQTRMTWAEQKRVFAMIPGLENAEYQRFGTVHRNTFLNSPVVLDDNFALKAMPSVYLAGQVSGVEGYVESAACGLAIGVMLAQRVRGETVHMPPVTTALGSLLGHLRRPNARFQPSNVVWSMFPPLDDSKLRKRARYEVMAERALNDINPWLTLIGREAQQAVA
ncbi:MAG: methylenetetrahydrofolate--tRNA-(uracil(54)-C(5))-methyltransferase (FADH(2)-oxidizing) TrmFO [Sandaracinaceae bacterium]|nr:methylenetetrahydrofolate--tRNA-(uracil(54)-C(5))-methyltransferase (FADH(2)-oxidizing) TrmFO [Sandaracinaceae bacterium]